MATRKETAQRKLSLVEELRRDVRSGRLAPGEMLPPVRILASNYGISRRVVNDEVQKLADEGWLQTVPRVGVFVRQPEESVRFLDHAVVVITGVTGEIPGHAQPGWVDYVTFGALQEIHRQGLHALVLHPDRLCGETLERLARDHPYGAIIPEMGDPLRYGQVLQENGVRSVMNGDDAGLAGFDRVKSDQERGAYELTRWLIAQGRRRIRQVWAREPGLYWCRERYAGYSRAMNEAGLTPLPDLDLTPPGGIPQPPEPRAAYCAGLLRASLVPDEGPGDDALLASSDGETAELFAACRLLGLDPHQDVLICGYDNYWQDLPAMGYAVETPAATVDKCNEAMGAAMVNLLLDRVREAANGTTGADSKPVCRVVHPTLIVPAT